MRLLDTTDHPIPSEVTLILTREEVERMGYMSYVTEDGVYDKSAESSRLYESLESLFKLDSYAWDRYKGRYEE